MKLAAGVTTAMALFAANSILCRLALARAGIDPASFTLLRIVSGAVVLGALLTVRARAPLGGNWRSAAMLVLYAAGFSLAYTSLPASVGAFLLFAAVQATMVAVGIAGGSRPTRWQLVGMAVALTGLALLLRPASGQVPVSLGPVLLMVGAGAAWGSYSLLGRQAQNPIAATAGNFVRGIPLCAAVLLTYWLLGFHLHATPTGLLLALLSGAVASGLGYTVLPFLTPTTAASVQLSVPAITAVVGALALGETLSWQSAIASVAILGGIALVVAKARA